MKAGRRHVRDLGKAYVAGGQTSIMSTEHPLIPNPAMYLMEELALPPALGLTDL